MVGRRTVGQVRRDRGVNDVVDTKIQEMARQVCKGLESGLLKPADINLRHYHCGDIYGRVMEVPEGGVVVGKVHLQGQINVCLKGQFAVLSGGNPRVVKAGEVLVCPKGDQRVFYAIEDSEWLVCVATEEQDIGKIEQQVVVDTREQYLALENKS